MNGDKFRQAFKEQALREQFRDEQRRKDEAMVHNMHQLAFGSNSAGSILSAASITDAGTFATTAATNLYATATAGVLSSKPYYKKEVDDASLFMDDNLKISAFNVYTLCTDDSMYKFDDTSTISSRYAITEYFNVMYYDNLHTPGSRCKYAINETKNVVKHLNFLTQTLENIVKHKSAFPIERIVRKWENLYKALI